MRNGERITQSLGQSSAKWQVLGRAGTSPQSVAQMARDMGLARQSVQRVANNLEEAGLVTFRDIPDDQRTFLVEITRQGRSVLSNIYKKNREWTDKLLQKVRAEVLAETASAVCHCDDCQRASSELESLPNTPKILDAAGGTAYVLYRKDRVICTKGNSLLQGHRTEGEQFTTRLIASCCNSPMYLDFEKGHWYSVFRDRFGDSAPRLQMRTQTKYVKEPTTIPQDVPRFSAYPFSFVAKLVFSKIAMDLAGISPKKSK